MDEEIVVVIEKESKETPLTGNVVNDIDNPHQEENAPSLALLKKVIMTKQKLKNNDFKVNQRGQTEYNYDTNGKYGIDVWQIRQGNYLNACIVTKLDNGCKVKLSNSGGGIRQYIPLSELSIGSNYTTSIKVNGSVYEGTTDLSSTTKKIISNDMFMIDFYYSGDNAVYSVWFINGNREYTIEFADLFEGNVAFPHVKEDYSIAFLRCRRFLKVYNTYVATGIVYGNTVHVTLQMDIDFLDTPTIIIQNLKAIVDGFESHELRYVDFIGFDGTCAFLTFITEGSGFSTSLYGHTARIYGTTSNSKMIISNEPL